VGDRHEVDGVELHLGLPELCLKIVRQLPADFVLDDQPCLALGDAEKAIEHLVGRDRIAMARQGRGMRPTRDDFAVDQHTVAVEDDERERPVGVLRIFLHAKPTFIFPGEQGSVQALSSSSGTQ